MEISLYTRDDCEGCKAVKEILKNFNYSYTEYKIGHNITREEVLRRFPAIRYVPIIVADEEVVGPPARLQQLLYEERDRQQARMELLKD